MLRVAVIGSGNIGKTQQKNLYFGINLNHRFVPPAERARKLIEEGELGDLLIHQHGAVDQQPQ